MRTGSTVVRLFYTRVTELPDNFVIPSQYHWRWNHVKKQLQAPKSFSTKFSYYLAEYASDSAYKSMTDTMFWGCKRMRPTVGSSRIHGLTESRYIFTVIATQLQVEVGYNTLIHTTVHLGILEIVDSS
jgi:hypothetical protein